MHFETALNCAWLLLGTAAIAGTVRAARHGTAGNKRFSACLQLIGIIAVVLALFPYISASDDVLRIASSVPQSSESGSRDTAKDTLRLYETVDSAIVSHGCSFAVTLAFVCVVAAFTVHVQTRTVPLALGRSPPFSSFLSVY